MHGLIGWLHVTPPFRAITVDTCHVTRYSQG